VFLAFSLFLGNALKLTYHSGNVTFNRYKVLANILDCLFVSQSFQRFFLRRLMHTPEGVKRSSQMYLKMLTQLTFEGIFTEESITHAIKSVIRRGTIGWLV